jgi:hypothetical protein
MKNVLATFFTLVLMVGSAFAHHGMENVMGTVASIIDNSITVTTTSGGTEMVTTTVDTKYSKTDGAITLKDIKGGRFVSLFMPQRKTKS